MSILTLEILGKPVACIFAEDRGTAEEIVQQSWLHRGLLSHNSDGTPLWDGSAKLFLRHPTQREIAIVEKRFEARHPADGPHSADSGAIVFLVPVEAIEKDENDEDFPI